MAIGSFSIAKCRWLLLSALVVALSLPANSATLSGTVTNVETGAPVAGVTISAARAGTLPPAGPSPIAAEASTKTDASGHYAITVADGLPGADRVLVFTQHPKQHLDLVRFGDWFSQRRGVVTVCRLVLGQLRDSEFDLRGMRDEIQALLEQEGMVAFADANVVPDVVEGISTVAQANGMAGMASNTILLGWPKDRSLMVEFLRVMRRLESVKKSVLIGRINPRYLFPREGVERSVHVWWGGLQRNSDLMLLLAYLLTRNPAWRGAKVKVMSIASSEVAKTETEIALSKLFSEIRMDVEAHVVIKPEDKSVREVIHSESEDAEVVFFGLATPEEGKEDEYAERLEQLAGDLGTVFFVKNSSLFVGELLQPTEVPEENTIEDEDDQDEEAAKSDR